MLDPNIENTQPSNPEGGLDPTQPMSTPPQFIPPGQIPPAQADPAATEPPTPPKKVKLWPLIVGGIGLILILGLVGGFFGYRAALTLRAKANAEQITSLATEQFMLGLQEQANGQLDLAYQRFEYVISLDPNFPGVQEKLAEVMIAQALLQTPSPTVPQATPTLTPTPDTRAEEEIFNNARELWANKQFAEALEVMDALRNKNLTYRAVQVDGMYYIALRFRGLAKINAGDLEEGLYDLALVERFAPLDVDADGVRTWARLYLAGAAYWEANWEKVIEYFAQVSPYYPSMRDSSGMTALERYRIALMKYGDEFAKKEQWCEAAEWYAQSYLIGADAALDPTATAVSLICNPPEPTQPTPTPSPTGGLPTLDVTTPPTEETPAPGPATDTPVPAPSETPTPGG